LQPRYHRCCARIEAAVPYENGVKHKIFGHCFTLSEKKKEEAGGRGAFAV